MKQALRKWSSSHLQLTSAAILTAMLSACGTPTENSSSSESSSSSVSSVVSSVSSSSSSVTVSSSSSVPQVVSLQDKCITGFDPHPTDGSLPDQYAEYTVNGQTDVTLRPEIIEWMEDHAWQEGHFLWHEVRRCGSFNFGPGFGGGSSVDVCDFTDMLPEQNECQGPQDGYEFLVMHRHMMNVLTSLWPSMDDHFKGWDTFPSREDYPSVVHPYFSQWNQQVLRAAESADNIPNMTREQVLQQWPTEGAFGQWIQCGSTGGGVSLNGLHGALHFNAYPQSNTDHSISNPRRNLDAYLFWKLHGWIDTAWEHYRQAVGKGPNDPDIQAELLKQCQEHHFWAEQVDPSLTQIDSGSGGNGQVGAGYVEEILRPAIQQAGCLGCHGTAQTAGLNLGAGLSTEQFIQRLVNVDARNVQNYKLVTPGDPSRSWLYLKLTGESETSGASCMPGQSTCLGSMRTNTSDDFITALRQWILDGATAN